MARSSSSSNGSGKGLHVFTVGKSKASPPKVTRVGGKLQLRQRKDSAAASTSQEAASERLTINLSELRRRARSDSQSSVSSVETIRASSSSGDSGGSDAEGDMSAVVSSPATPATTPPGSPRAGPSSTSSVRATTPAPSGIRAKRTFTRTKSFSSITFPTGDDADAAVSSMPTTRPEHVEEDWSLLSHPRTVAASIDDRGEGSSTGRARSPLADLADTLASSLLFGGAEDERAQDDAGAAAEDAPPADWEMTIYAMRTHTALWDLPDDRVCVWHGVLMVMDPAPLDQIRERYAPLRDERIQFWASHGSGIVDSPYGAPWRIEYRGARITPGAVGEKIKLDQGVHAETAGWTYTPPAWQLNFWVPIPVKVLGGREHKVFKVRAGVKVVLPGEKERALMSPEVEVSLEHLRMERFTGRPLAISIHNRGIAPL